MLQHNNRRVDRAVMPKPSLLAATVLPVVPKVPDARRGQVVADKKSKLHHAAAVAET